jgi:hypothetical protein
MKLVVAGDYAEFCDYCRENGLNPSSRPRTVKYIGRYEDFLVDEAELICYGSYEKNPVWQNQETRDFMIEYGKSRNWTGV